MLITLISPLDIFIYWITTLHPTNMYVYCVVVKVRQSTGNNFHLNRWVSIICITGGWSRLALGSGGRIQEVSQSRPRWPGAGLTAFRSHRAPRYTVSSGLDASTQLYLTVRPLVFFMVLGIEPRTFWAPCPAWTSAFNPCSKLKTHMACFTFLFFHLYGFVFLPHWAPSSALHSEVVT
jgi:hypothetical protein